MSNLRIAIVGAGPAGIFAADLLAKAERELHISIDLFEKLPAPYGLVRYGVAPDHPRIKGIVNSLRQVLDNGDVRLFGNVEYGVDLSLEDLQDHYHAVIFSTGARRDADLDIPGIGLDGSYGAADFVSWYDGHPDVSPVWPLNATGSAVIGNGNVALDVARMLIKHPADLLTTEIPDSVYEGLSASPITDVHIIGRRGPMQVKFTPLELREIGELNDVDIILNPEDFDYDDASLRAKESNKQLMVIDRVFRSWLDRPTGNASRRLHFHFYSRPDELVADEVGVAVAGIRLERTFSDGIGGVSGSEEFREIPVQSVYRAVGYVSSPVRDIPFDDARGVIPNIEGRVLRTDETSPEQLNEVLPGVYVTGWIKRGPIGLIGHTKSDAMETVEHVLNDGSNWWSPTAADANSILTLLEERGVQFTNLDGWHALDDAEIALGEAADRERIKIIDRDEMVNISRSGM